jgi:hypothetical protein
VFYALFAIGGASAASAASIAAQGQAAAATDGTVALGKTSYVDAAGVTHGFWGTFVIPAGTVTGTGQIGSDPVDLQKPWVNFAETLSTDRYALCLQNSNPTSYSAGTPGSAPGTVTGLYVDVRCDDGAGYQFYRLTFVGDGTDLGGSSYWQFGADTQTSMASVTFGYNHLERGQWNVCGYDGTSFRCFPHNTNDPGDWVMTFLNLRYLEATEHDRPL